jgi:hypothetical protein
MIFSGRVFHEAIKGIVNCRLYLGSTNAKFKSFIDEFVQDIKDFSRRYIWIPRCNAMNEWEQSKGITSQIKRQCKKDQTSIPSFQQISEKLKTRFINDALQRWTGFKLANGNRIIDYWSNSDLSDLWYIITTLYLKRIDMLGNIQY